MDGAMGKPATGAVIRTIHSSRKKSARAIYKFEAVGVYSIEKSNNRQSENRMDNFEKPAERGGRQRARPVQWSWLILAGALLVVLVGVFMPPVGKRASQAPAATNAPASGANQARWTATISMAADRASAIHQRRAAESEAAAEQIVTNKFHQFVQHRREILHKIAQRFNVKVPPDFDQFLDVADSGDWGSITNSFEALMKLRKSGSLPGDAVEKLWPVLTETYGVADSVHKWPPRQLLDYGNTILDSLGPDMVYLGGTDPGRFIPTLLNDTSDGAQHVVLTQNALADGSYLDYVNFLYGGQIRTLSSQESQQAFESYIQDAQKRLQHDKEFPNEPAQVRPGENISVTQGRIQAGGQAAVMAINEKLVQMLMQKNPDSSFAMETSFPFKSMYSDATTLGPIMQLGVKDPQAAMTPENADASVNYWENTSQQLLGELAVNDSAPVRQEYAKMASDQASLLLAHEYSAEAESDFQIADQLCPSSPEVVVNYVNFLLSKGRKADAVPVLRNALALSPDNQAFQQLLKQATK